MVWQVTSPAGINMKREQTQNAHTAPQTKSQRTPAAGHMPQHARRDAQSHISTQAHKDTYCPVIDRLDEEIIIEAAVFKIVNNGGEQPGKFLKSGDEF